MPVTPDQIIVWLIVGLLGGALAGALVTGDRKGLGWWTNLGVGLVGALIGGALFRLFGILPVLDKVSVSLRDIAAAVTGSLLFVLARWLLRRQRAAHSTGP